MSDSGDCFVAVEMFMSVLYKPKRLLRPGREPSVISFMLLL